MTAKLLVLLGSLLLATNLTAAAPAPTTQGSSTQSRLERFRTALEQLNLTADQKEKIKTIFTEVRGKLEAIKGDKQARGQAREIVQKARTDILAVLSDEQKAKLKEILKNDQADSKA